jgi:hypothetical protein
VHLEPVIYVLGLLGGVPNLDEVQHRLAVGFDEVEGSLDRHNRYGVAGQLNHVERPFPKSPNGQIVVKVINHLGDEVMKVFKVS